MPSKKIKADDALFAFDLPADKAIEYLKSKGYAISFDWDDLTSEAHRRAFTVAKVMKLDILVTIKEMLVKAQEEGITFEDFKKQIEPQLAKKGWWGVQEVKNPLTGKRALIETGSHYRLQTIFRQNMQSSYMAGRFKQQMEIASRKTHFGEYIAVRDNRTTSQCLYLDGTVLPMDHPFWATSYPPNHFLCRAAVITYTENQLQRDGLEVSSDDSIKFYKPSKGFEGSPADPFVPDLSKYPSALQRLYNADKGGTD